MLISQIPCPDFGPKIPSVKWCCRIADASDFESHVGNRWQRMPLETETRKPGIVGMFDWDFQDDLRRQFKQFWFLARHLNDQWKNVKGRAFSTFPPKLEDLVCQADMRRIANNGAI